MKKGFRVLLATLLALTFVVVLTACDFGSSNKEGDKKKNNETSVKTEKKVKLEDAMDNYEKEEAKKSEMTTSLQFGMYLALSSDSTDTVERAFTMNADVNRVTDGKKVYADGTIYPTDVPDNVKSLIQALMKNINTIGNIPLGKNKQQVEQAIPYLEFLQDFLLRNLDVSARMGIAGSTVNLKTEYERKLSGGKTERDDAWYYTTDAKLSSFLGINVATDLAVEFLKTPVMGKATYKGTDRASEHVDLSGVASYDIAFDQETYNANTVTYLMDMLSRIGTVATDAQKKAAASVMKTISGWIQPDEYSFRATVGADKLPVNTKATISIVIDIPRVELAEVLKDLKEAEILEEEVVDKINGIAYLLTSIGNTRSKDGEKNHLGFRVSLTNDESFKYGASSIGMDKLDKDLFIEADQTAEGRIEATEALNVVIEEKASQVVADLIETIAERIEDVDLENIVGEVIEKLDFSQKVTVLDVKTAIILTLQEHGIEIKAELKAGEEEDKSPDENNPDENGENEEDEPQEERAE